MAEVRANQNGVHELTPQEGRDLLEYEAQCYLHMTGEEFLRRYDAGEFDVELDERPELRRLEMLIPLGR